MKVSRLAFDYILRQIEDKTIFTNESNFPQAPVWLQQAVALDRFRNDRSGVSLSRTTELWGIGQGTCALYTYRVMQR